MASESYEALSIPPGAQRDGGVEVLRAAIAGENLSLSIRRAFEDPQAWGSLLATVALHVSRVYAQELGLGEQETRDRIRRIFDVELAAPGDLATVREPPCRSIS